jgi:hypothetical protein
MINNFFSTSNDPTSGKLLSYNSASALSYYSVWLTMTKEVAYRKILSCTNKDQIRKLGRYVNNVKYKWFNKMKEG